MAQRIVEVDACSIADQLGILPGDLLLAINGERIVDFIDYQSLSANEEIVLDIQRDGETHSFEFEKDEYEPLGLGFDTPMMSGLRNCANTCVFCFVDQLPAQTRPSMHVKDDDWRTSLLMGSFVTLTNVGEKELDRIIKRHATPLYISVHATDDELRAHLLGTSRGKGIMHQLKRLSDGGIQFHSQAVLCPGVNDGQALDQTISDLAGLMPDSLSLALVPVGLTGHRQGLAPIHGYDKQSAQQTLDLADRWRETLLESTGTRFVFPADEYYLLAGRDFPSDEEYEGYPQIDNGIGLCRLLETEFADAYHDMDDVACEPAKIAIACGTSVAPFLKGLMERYPIDGLNISIYPIENEFFGHSVNVSGLLTGSDLLRELKGIKADRLLITECMIRDGEDVFLDDMSIPELENALKIPIVPVGRTGEDLLRALRNE